MNKPRELFARLDIVARSGEHVLLKNGKPKVIGFITDKKRYTLGGGCIIPREVCFHYGTENYDFFYFENLTIVYQAVTIKTPEYITEVYSKCSMKETTPDELIKQVLEVYVFTELGF